MFNPRHIIELIASNLDKVRNPFGVPHGALNTWWENMSLRREGDAMLFTGLMYQSLPYIEKTTSHMERLEDTRRGELVRYGKYLPKPLVGLGFALMVSEPDKAFSSGILQNIWNILVRSNVDFFYRPELDAYSGILLYDLGDEEAFARHAKYVSRRLKDKGVRKLITVDPHTTYAMKVLYPRYTGISFEVRTYFELINLRAKPDSTRVTLHDPCFYGRYLELSDVPGKVLNRIGIECVAVRNCGKFTNCCGGPAESISPKLTREVLDRRISELEETGQPIIAMCPICLSNLKRAGAQVEDLSTLIARHT
jgi:Fe-S oxidoreductase